MIGLIKDIASSLLAPIANVFVANAEVKKVRAKAKVDIASAIAEREVAKIMADTASFTVKTTLDTKKVEVNASVDQQLIAMRRNSYLDEVVILVILSPAILVFVPKFQPYIENGFKILQTLPDFYQALLVLVVVMTVGGVGLIRDLLGKFGRK